MRALRLHEIMILRLLRGEYRVMSIRAYAGAHGHIFSIAHHVERLLGHRPNALSLRAVRGGQDLHTTTEGRAQLAEKRRARFKG
jgi:hypothetical protein